MTVERTIISSTGEVILALNPSANFVVRGSDLDTCTIEWRDGTPEISKADIKTKRDSILAEYDAKEYARKRKTEYPTIEALVVALYDTDDKAAIDAKRAEIKLKYPKS